MNEMFNEVKEAQELCDTDGKYASKTVVKNGIHYYLCATPLALEGEIEDKVTECFEELADKFRVPYDDSDVVDFVSEIRDKIIESFEKLTKGRVIYGYIEY